MEANSINGNYFNSMLQRRKAPGLVYALLIGLSVYSQEIKRKPLNPCYTCEDKVYRAKGFIVAGCTVGIGTITLSPALPAWYDNMLVGASIYLNLHGIGLYFTRDRKN